MRGLIMKDLYNLKQFAKQYLLMLGVLCLFAFPMKSPMYIIFMGVIMGITYMFSSLAFDEAGGFSFSLMLPVSRKQIIGAKYLMQILAMVGVIVMTGVLGAVIAGWHKIGYIEWIPSLLAATGGFIIIMSVMIPISIKWKVEKARIIFIGIIMVFGLGFFAAGRTIDKGNLKDILGAVNTQRGLFLLLGGFVAVSVICMVISYYLSVKIFKKKEF